MAELWKLIYFLTRDQLNILVAFQQQHKNIRAIINRTEVFIPKVLGWSRQRHGATKVNRKVKP